MIERIIMAGFGGQGVMTIGKLLATVAMNTGKVVTYFPSYGAEVRGGTAHCHVIISDEEIYSPVVESADALFIMNQPSYDKFRSKLRPGGILVINSSMAKETKGAESASPATCVSIPATDTAKELGNVRVANVVMLGAYLALRPLVPTEAVLAAIDEASLSTSKANLLEINHKALLLGGELAAKSVASLSPPST